LEYLHLQLCQEEIRSFLMIGELFWLHKHHADGHRVDTLTSMPYRDSSARMKKWALDIHVGRKTLCSFIQKRVRISKTGLYERGCLALLTSQMSSSGFILQTGDSAGLVSCAKRRTMKNWLLLYASSLQLLELGTESEFLSQGYGKRC
jgi:hypothetical protein